MKLLPLAFLTLFAAAFAANPISAETAQSEAVITQEFYLRTTNSHIPEYNRLYVMAYQTGPNSGDTVLTADAASATPVYLNGTRALVDLGTSSPWGLILSEEIDYGIANNAWKSLFLFPFAGRSRMTRSSLGPCCDQRGRESSWIPHRRRRFVPLVLPEEPQRLDGLPVVPQRAATLLGE